MAMVPVMSQKNTKRGYQGITEVRIPATNIVTDEIQIAFLRPNLSETKPDTKDPSAKPNKIKNINKYGGHLKYKPQRNFYMNLNPGGVTIMIIGALSLNP